jgi:hypothetical protein
MLCSTYRQYLMLILDFRSVKFKLSSHNIRNRLCSVVWTRWRIPENKAVWLHFVKTNSRKHVTLHIRHRRKIVFYFLSNTNLHVAYTEPKQGHSLCVFSAIYVVVREMLCISRFAWRIWSHLALSACLLNSLTRFPSYSSLPFQIKAIS